ncbi:MAG TPA: hypothetical protein VER33_09070 [Polyangiaceae bacterium]|nr:hypothetical protein [Polyangiaceae bacterium]
MNRSIRLKPLTALFTTSLVVPLLLTGCGEDNPLTGVTDALCCTEFQVGADMSKANFDIDDAAMKGQFTAFAQAGSDLAAVATATMAEVSVACENIARDLGAAEADSDAAEALTGSAAVTRWCELASAQVEAKLSGLDPVFRFQEPRCTASVEASVDCQAACDVNGECDVAANPPKCTGGQLTVECGGTCTAEANVAVSCTGSCEGTCTGSCTVDAEAPAMRCEGQCEGTCSANVNGGGNGTQADGSCAGFCKGTCTPTDGSLAVECQGTCEGSCQGSCTAAADARFSCNGACSADAVAPRCEGGTLEVDCKVEGSCKANCDASANARAECEPPQVSIGFANPAAELELRATLATLEANLPPLVVAVRARGSAFAGSIKASFDASGRIAADFGDLSANAVGCAPVILETIGTASANFRASLTGATSVLVSVGAM